MRNISMWSLGVCTLCAALVQAQAPPKHRAFLPADEKQSVNKLAPRDGLRSFSEKPEVRSFLSDSTAAPVSEDKSAKYALGALDIHNLSRDIGDSTQTRHLSFLRLVPGEKASFSSESAPSRSLTAPSKHRFLLEEPSGKPRDFSSHSESR